MRANQGLKIYKRHNCGSTDGQFFECACPVWVVGRTPAGDIVPRQSTGTSSRWEAEREVKRILRSSSPSPAVNDSHGLTLAQAANKYLASREHELSVKTYRQHRVMLERLTSFCLDAGIQYVRDLNVDCLENFKLEGLPASMVDTSRATSVAKLRCFLRTAFRRGWISEHLAEKITPHSAVYEQKKPYTDEEIELILEESLWLDHGHRRYAAEPETFRLLLELMLETGLRVGDAVRYNPSAVKMGDGVWVYRYFPQKNKKVKRPKPHDVYLEDRLKAAIENCQWLSPARPFEYGSFSDESYLATQVYARMRSIGERCGVADCRPHRLRDTFAVRKLLDGFSLDDVSRLLGHSSVKVTEEYYAAWVPARGARLEGLVAQSIMHARNSARGNRKGSVDAFAGSAIRNRDNVRLIRK